MVTKGSLAGTWRFAAGVMVTRGSLLNPWPPAAGRCQQVVGSRHVAFLGRPDHDAHMGLSIRTWFPAAGLMVTSGSSVSTWLPAAVATWVSSVCTWFPGAGLVAAFPGGAKFWAGDPSSQEALTTWPSQRASWGLDYKRKRRDALRHTSKRYRQK